jgi:predicted nucleotidyltransferase
MTALNASGPTPYVDVNNILQVMLRDVQAILGPQLVAFYLYGSLSSGDFDPASSDIDFLIVTAEELSEAAMERLRAMHADIVASGMPYASRLEGSYIPRAALRRYDPQNARHPTIGGDWPFHVGWHGYSWVIERYIVREHGVVVWGPPPSTLIDPVSPQELRAAVCTQIQEFWRARLDSGDVEWLRPREYQAFAALTFCRALYTLLHGAVISKPQAAAWAMEAYPQWRPIIERALLWRSQHKKDDLTETLTFMHEALLQVQEVC